MATDFSYNEKTINSSGPMKPSGINQPLDPRTEVKLYADIKLIPNPYVGMIITVLEDETNSNKMTDYKVLSLKSDDLGVANSVVDRVQRYVEYLGVSTGGGTGLTPEQEAKLNSIDNKVDKINGKGLSTNDYTTEEKATLSNLKTAVGDTNSGLIKDVKDLKTNGVSQDNINSAIENYLRDHPVQSGATPEQAAQIQTNKNDIADIINNKLDGKTFKFLTQAEYDALSESEKNNETIEYHITDAPENSHTHTNKEVLDKISENAEGSLLFNGNKITSDVTNSHTHTNKEILDKISEDTDGSLLFNGNKITSGPISGGITTVKYENLSAELKSLFVVIK